MHYHWKPCLSPLLVCRQHKSRRAIPTERCYSRQYDTHALSLETPHTPSPLFSVDNADRDEQSSQAGAVSGAPVGKEQGSVRGRGYSSDQLYREVRSLLFCIFFCNFFFLINNFHDITRTITATLEAGMMWSL